MFYNAVTVELYNLPSIQFNNCCYLVKVLVLPSNTLMLLHSPLLLFMDTKILHWNCTSLFLRKLKILHLIPKHRPVILIISETWLNLENRMISYSSLQDDRNYGNAGSAFQINRLVSFPRVALHPRSPNIDVIAVKVI